MNNRDKAESPNGWAGDGAARRDRQKIDTVLKKYEQSDADGRKRLVELLREGRLEFETPMGGVFLERMEARYREEAGPAGGRAPEADSQSRGKAEEGKQEKKAAAQKERIEAGYRKEAGPAGGRAPEADSQSRGKAEEGKREARAGRARQEEKRKQKKALRQERKQEKKAAAQKKIGAKKKAAASKKAAAAAKRRNTAKAPRRLEDYDEDMQKIILQELARQEKKRRRMILLCSLTAFFCVGYLGLYYYSYEKNSAQNERLSSLREEAGEEGLTINYIREEEKGELVVLDKYKKLYSQNKSLIGWLKIDDTNIDYPVMQTVNNEYYLDHNYTQEYDPNGSIFLDKDCDIANPGDNMIIYGHHMKSGKMFGRLYLYQEKEYYEEHPLIQFDTIYEEGTYQVMYVFRSRVYNEDEITFKYYQFLDAATPGEFDSHMREMAAMSYYDTGVTATFGDKLITLSTCDDAEEEDGRFVVVAKRIK